MKQISFTQFKKLPAKDIREGGCYSVTADGEPLCIVVVGAREGMQTEILSRCGVIDASRGV